MDAMKFFDRFRRGAKEAAKGNRTLNASELLAREAKAEAEAAKATAARLSLIHISEPTRRS